MLAEELSRTPDTVGALEAYADRRLDRARLVVEASGEIARLEQSGRQSEVPGVLGRTHGALAASAQRSAAEPGQGRHDERPASRCRASAG